MNKKRNKYIKWLGAVANVIAMVYFLGVVGTVAFINPARPTVSEIEKRELAQKPEFSFAALSSGSYTKGLSTFFADTFLFRDELIQIGNAIKDHMGFRLDGIKLYGTAAGDVVMENSQQAMPAVLPMPEMTLPEPQLPLPESSSQAEEVSSKVEQASSEESSIAQSSSQSETVTESVTEPVSAPVSEQLKAEISSSAPDAPSSKAEPVKPSVSEKPSSSLEPKAESVVSATSESEGESARVGSILAYDGIGYTLFGGTEKMGEWYGQVINAYGDILGEKVKVYNMVVPTSVEFNLPEKYKNMTVSQRARLDNIKFNLSDKVQWVDIYEKIDEHKDEYLFFRTDHHWTALGAYYAYQCFADAAGFEPVPLESMEKRTLEGFLGTLYSQTQDSKMIDNADHVDYFVLPNMPKCYIYKLNAPDTALKTGLYGEYAKSYNSYSVFMHGDFPVFIMDTGLDNGRRIAVVKESYGNAFVPFLANNYERVVVIDQRYLQKSLYEVLEENGINELLFINNILAAHTPVRINELATLPARSYTPPPESEVAETQSSQQSSEQPKEE